MKQWVEVVGSRFGRFGKQQRERKTAMKRVLSLFAMCCLVSFGYGCNNPDRTGTKTSTETKTAQGICQPAVFVECGTCPDGSPKWKLCQNDGVSFGECKCNEPVAKVDAGNPSPTATTTSTTTATQTATSSGLDSGVVTPTLVGCVHKDGLLPNGSIRPCGYERGECHTGTQTCANNVWSSCQGGILPVAEVCDGKDNDCNGKFDDGIVCECDPNSPPLPCGSNVGMCKKGHQECVKTGDGYRWGTECLEEVKSREEHCDNLDWDCDGVKHNGFSLMTDPNNCGACGVSCARSGSIGHCSAGVCKYECQLGYYDLDGKPENGCEYLCPYTKPLAAEIANGLDDNCNGLVDEGFNLDTDAVNCGKAGRKCQFENAVSSCVDGDCRVASCKTGYVDLDKDPWNGCEKQCSKTSNSEICGNKLDDNCNGEVDEGCDCDPADTTPVECGNNTGICKSTKSCKTNGKYGSCTVVIGPKAKRCDAVDHLDYDCNGLADETEYDLSKDVMNCGSCGNVALFPNAKALCVNGVPQMGSCSLGFYDLDHNATNGCEYGPILPTNGGIEQCDGIDNDANGKIDDGTAVCACTLIGSTRPCGPPDIGECRSGVQSCKAPGQWDICDLKKAILPSPEICNGKDDDCDGVADNGFSLLTDPNNCGACNVKCSVANGTAACVAGKCTVGQCNPYWKDVNGKFEDGCEKGPCIAEGVEICDGRDNDCDGKIDNDVVGGCGCVIGSTKTCGKNVGNCHAGTTTCVGPAPGSWSVCEGEVVSQPERCDDIDWDCDGVANNNFNLMTDVNNCGKCGNVCKYANASAACVAGVCQMVDCDRNWYDINKSAIDGCEVPCVVTNGGVEQCDGIDNNCNGVKDEGIDKNSSLLHCGLCNHACVIPNAVPVCTNGECKVSACNPGYWDLNNDPKDGCEHACVPTNGGVEICDGLDNDCDGTPDDGIFCNCTTAQSPRECGTGVGMCQSGTQTCVSGVWQACTGMVDPKPIVCDSNTDLNCNGIVDSKEWDTKDDVNNCGGCGIVCSFPHASASCVSSACVMGACEADYYNLDGKSQNGCEYGKCLPTRGGVEYCDGIDNDCDGLVDTDATTTVKSDSMNCGSCGNSCALPNVAINGCYNGGCAIVHCLPGWTDANGLATDGCEAVVLPPDGGTGGNIGTGGVTGTGGSTSTGGVSGTGGTAGTGGSSNPDGGVVQDGGVSIPPSIGTIVCSKTGSTMTVVVNGLVSLGLESELPAGSISSLALGMDWGTCWPANGSLAGCRAQTVDPNTVDSISHVWTDVPQTRFTPRVTSSVWFQLRYWTILGDCIREGCGFCRPGEVCEPTLEPPRGCIAKAKPNSF